MTSKDVGLFLNAVRAALNLPGMDLDALYVAYSQFGYHDRNLPVERVATIVVRCYLTPVIDV